MNHTSTCNTLYVEKAKLLSQTIYANKQYHIRLHSPQIANHAKPGHFVHIQCDPNLFMRRPMSIMRSDPENQTIDVLYKVHGHGTSLLSKQKINDSIDLIGPIGQPFKLSHYKKWPLLIGGGIGIPPIIFLAEHIKKLAPRSRSFVVIGSEIPFPFRSKPSQIILKEVPSDVIACMPLLENLDITSRLTSLQGYPGCFNGYVTELARYWLDRLSDDQHKQVEIFSCGPISMLKAVNQLAKEYDLPCQVSLEEYMACAVGGCAGCAVLIQTDKGPSMKRVCVDGPVFEASSVIQLQD